MAKNSKRLLTIIITLTLCVAVLAGCAPAFKPVAGGSPEADTVSNNGMVVKQGEYYYFINGLETYENLSEIKNNKFGKPLKGAICRVKKNAEGVYEDFQIVVPKVILNKNKEQGFSIFGNYIYYISPSTTTDTKGVVQVGYTEFFRCKIDGSETQQIALVEGDTLQYKFTDRGLIYQEAKDIKCVPYTDKGIGKVKTIAEEVTSAAFSVSDTYKVGVESAQDFVFYTKAVDEENAGNNELFAVNGDGSTIVKLIEKLSYTADANDKNNQFMITLKMVKVEANGDVVIYYEKGGSYAVEGLFGYNLGSASINGEFKFDKTKEKQFTNRAGLTAIPLSFSEGVFINDTTNGMLYIPTITNGLEVSRIEWKFTKGYTLSISDIVKTESGMYLLHTPSAGRLDKIMMNPTGGFDGSSIPVLTKGLGSDWLRYERIGDEIFFLNSKYLNYMYVADMKGIDTTSEEGLKPNMIGKMTDKDKEAYDKQIKAEEEEAAK